MDALHPISRAAFGALLWRLSDLSPEGELVEPAVWAARAMAAQCEHAGFVPFGTARRRLHLAGGEPAQRLAAWYAAVATGARPVMPKGAASRNSARLPQLQWYLSL